MKLSKVFEKSMHLMVDNVDHWFFWSEAAGAPHHAIRRTEPRLDTAGGQYGHAYLFFGLWFGEEFGGFSINAENYTQSILALQLAAELARDVGC